MIPYFEHWAMEDVWMLRCYDYDVKLITNLYINNN